jgi:hypothetical protein
LSAKHHLDRVSDLGCILCRHLGLGVSPAEIHHVESIKDGLSDFAVVPLCQEHHRGPTGVHGLRRRGFEATYKLTDIDLLAMVNRELSK